MIPTEDIMPMVKNTIAASVKRNTHGGCIGWSSCDNICMDMYECLDLCEKALEKHEKKRPRRKYLMAGSTGVMTCLNVECAFATK